MGTTSLRDIFEPLYTTNSLSYAHNSAFNDINNTNNNNQFNKTTLHYIYTLNYMAKFMKYLKIIRANNCSLLVTRTCKFFKRVYTNSYILQL